MSGYNLFLVTVHERCDPDHMLELFWWWSVEGGLELALGILPFNLLFCLLCQLALVKSPSTSASPHSQDEECTTPNSQDVSSASAYLSLIFVLHGQVEC